jgi:hypothetical protein
MLYPHGYSVRDNLAFLIIIPLQSITGQNPSAHAHERSLEKEPMNQKKPCKATGKFTSTSTSQCATLGLSEKENDIGDWILGTVVIGRPARRRKKV